MGAYLSRLESGRGLPFPSTWIVTGKVGVGAVVLARWRLSHGRFSAGKKAGFCLSPAREIGGLSVAGIIVSYLVSCIGHILVAMS